MTQTSNRILDEMARLMTDAAGVARGVRDEAETVFRAQAERILNDLDVVTREEFEAVRLMAETARRENEILGQRIGALEAQMADPKPAPAKAAPAKAAAAKPARAASASSKRASAAPKKKSAE